MSAVGNPTHIDFIRGFGLDVPLESEEEGEEEEVQRPRQNEELSDEEATGEMDQYAGDGDESEIDDNTTTAPQTRVHSRHVSKLSAAMSLRSVGGNFRFDSTVAEAVEQQQELEDRAAEADHSEMDGEDEEGMVEVDPVEEWTGSEDVYLGLETSDDEVCARLFSPFVQYLILFLEYRRVVKPLRRGARAATAQRTQNAASKSPTAKCRPAPPPAQLPAPARERTRLPAAPGG